MILAIGFLIISLGVFLFGCFAAASDAQGAILFIFIIPVILGLLGYNIYWSRKNFKRTINVISISGFVFTTLFVVFAFVPGLNLFPATVVGFVSKGFELVTGQTPYAWTREKNDVLALVNRDLKTPESMDMSTYKTSRDWKRVCFMGPYTTDEAASKILGYKYPLSQISSVNSSDSITTLAFSDDKTIVYFLDYPRSIADFHKLSGQCVEKRKAKFKQEMTGSKVYILQ